MSSQNYFSLMVVGENPDELIKPYDKSLTVDMHVAYKKEDMHKIRLNDIEVFKKLLEIQDINEKEKVYFMRRLSIAESSDDLSYFLYITSGMDYDSEGNALTDENPNGKYDYISIARRFATPLKLVDGTESFSAKCEDVDFAQMHHFNESTYEMVWELLVEGKEPKTQVEQTIYENMKSMENYMKKFSSKEDYVSYNTSLFYYAYLDKDGWKDMDDAKSPNDWIVNFYDRFIEPMNPKELITLYECRILD